jgi:polyphenol oxidase
MARLLFTAKAGGSSSGSFESLNVAQHVGDSENEVIRNRLELSQLVSLDSLQFMDQVHGNEVAVITESSNTPPVADALVTKVKNLGLVVQVADCLPILIDGGGVIAAVHVGRKGMVNGIIEKTIMQIEKLGGVGLRAVIGAGICGDCYEVDPDTYNEIISKFPESSAGFRKIDIRKSARHQLNSLGVIVEDVLECTLENSKYFSYRRGKVTGRQCGVIAL